MADLAGPANVTRIPVGGDSPYEVLVGTGVLGELPALVPTKVETVAIIHDERLSDLAEQARLALDAAGFSVVARAVPSGEAAKTIDVAAGLWSWLGQARVTRSDCVVGIGGGATTDLAGFGARHYPVIRKELMRRYPRHSWPEDPTQPAPRMRPRRPA